MKRNNKSKESEALSNIENASSKINTHTKAAVRSRHPLEYLMAVIAILSLSLNIFLFLRGEEIFNIQYPGPIVERMSINVEFAEALTKISNRTTIFDILANYAFVDTQLWKSYLENIATWPSIKKQNTIITFLVLKNRSKSNFSDITLEGTQISRFELPAIEIGHTLLIFEPPGFVKQEAMLKYRLHGSNKIRSVPISKRSTNTVTLITELGALTKSALRDLTERDAAILESVKRRFK